MNNEPYSSTKCKPLDKSLICTFILSHTIRFFINEAALEQKAFFAVSPDHPLDFSVVKLDQLLEFFLWCFEGKPDSGCLALEALKYLASGFAGTDKTHGSQMVRGG